MKNKIYMVSILSLLTIASFQCKSPVDELKKFQLNLSGDLVKPNFYVKLSSNDSLIGANPQNVFVHITGRDAHLLYDENGNKDFKVIDGRIGFIISQNASVTQENPLIFNIEAYCPNALPIKEQVYVFGNDNQAQFTYYFQNEMNPTDGSVILKKTLSFLGKKTQDTITFEGAANGINFKYTFPTKGVYFWKKRVEKFFDGPEQIIRDTVRVATITQTFNGQTQSRTVRVPSGGKIISIKVDTMFRKVTMFDTIPLSEKITALVRIKPQFKTIQQSQFYDGETGEYYLKPYYFKNTSEVSLDFKDANGESLQIFYPFSSYFAEFTSANFTDNSKIIVSGKTFNTDVDKYTDVNQIVNPKQYKIENDNGLKKISFNCNLIGGKIVIFEDKVEGCRYASVRINSNLNPSQGFYYATTLNVFEPGSQNLILSYRLSTSESNNYYNTENLTTELTIPGFEGYNYQIVNDVNHYENTADGNFSPLYTQKTTINDICNYSILNPKIININYSSPYSDFVKLNVKASLNCSGGNFVIPSTNLFFVRKDAKDVAINGNVIDRFSYYGQIFLDRGRVSTMRLRNNKEYFVFATNNDGFRWGSNITLNTAKEETIIKDAEGYFSGVLKYDNTTNTFDFTVTFENSKMKYKINGCGY